MTREEAVKMYDSRWWETCSDEKIVAYQLWESRLCMPFGEFHRAVEIILERPVWTHEFAKPELLRSELREKHADL